MDFEKTSTNEICIYTINSIPNLDNQVIYVTKLANRLGVRKADKNNGLLLLIVKYNRQVAFATGYRIALILTDFVCKHLIDYTLISSFKKRDYIKGVTKVLDLLKVKWID